jgi:hypothetical protein
MMTNERPVLRDLFAQEEKDAPDSAGVYAEVERLAKGYRQRRRGWQAAGGAVLGAGLIAGALQLPQFLGHDDSGTSGGTGLVQAAGSPGPSASVTLPKGKSFEPPDEWQIFFNAGYNSNDAEQLRKLWKLPEVGDAKVKAGKLIADGKDLPLTKHAPAQEYPMPDRLRPDEKAALAKYRAAGYDEGDVARLARVWKFDMKATSPDYRQAKIVGVEIAAGRELIAGRKLPIKP